MRSATTKKRKISACIKECITADREKWEKKETNREKSQCESKWEEKDRRGRTDKKEKMQVCAEVLCFGFWFSDRCWGGRNAIFSCEFLTIPMCTVPEKGGEKQSDFNAPKGSSQCLASGQSYSYVLLMYTSPTFHSKTLRWGVFQKYWFHGAIKELLLSHSAPIVV